MARTTTTKYDVSEHLRNGERSRGFDTILKVIAALSLTLHAEAAHTNNATAERGGAAKRRE